MPTEQYAEENLIRMADYTANVDRLANVARSILDEVDKRSAFFDNGLFGDPVWYILLDLYIHAAERRTVSVSSLCVAARVPATTALRWINNLTNRGLLERFSDPSDRRRAHIRLSRAAHEQMSAYLAMIESDRGLREPAKALFRQPPLSPG
ncbi:MAG: winged helix DNA-binding protein [Sphingobium sp.]|nr:winged helix DNA-binding protein [Sphingobium sp.]MCI1271243.1 winged helix DNA-binding protein [Sphingobium sp.]MCI1756065.1 winged helix DNA-binding protein [Sphingobium sp.]MCI2052640.1 winged helix DNA-binding protein [Sphingobium sp.]